MSPKIRNGSVTAIDIQKKTITAAHVKPGRYGPRASGRGAAGGAEGRQGRKGASGIANAYTKRTSGPTQALTATLTTIVSLPLPKGR